jgi:hypothetical protein
MKRHELKALITEVINEVVNEMGAPDSGKKVNQQVADLLAQGHEVFSGAVGRIGKIISVDGNVVRLKRSRGRGPAVTTFNTGDEVAIEQAQDGKYLVMNADGLFENATAGGKSAVIARIDNTVFPLGEDQIEKAAEDWGIMMRYIGDAAFGTDTLKAYRVKFVAAQGQLDSFVDMLAQEEGIDFAETTPDGKAKARMNENRVLKWKDGVEVPIDNAGNPVGYEALGYTNSGITVPDSDDWRRFYENPRGHEKYLSAKLKKWYEVDSSG